VKPAIDLAAPTTAQNGEGALVSKRVQGAFSFWHRLRSPKSKPPLAGRCV